MDFVPARRFIYYCIQLLLSFSSSPALPISQNHFHFTLFDLFFLLLLLLFSRSHCSRCVCVCQLITIVFHMQSVFCLSADQMLLARLLLVVVCHESRQNVIRHTYICIVVKPLCGVNTARMMRSRTRTSRRRLSEWKKKKKLFTQFYHLVKLFNAHKQSCGMFVGKCDHDKLCVDVVVVENGPLSRILQLPNAICSLPLLENNTEKKIWCDRWFSLSLSLASTSNQNKLLA